MVAGRPYSGSQIPMGLWVHLPIIIISMPHACKRFQSKPGPIGEAHSPGPGRKEGMKLPSGQQAPQTRAPQNTPNREFLGFPSPLQASGPKTFLAQPLVQPLATPPGSPPGLKAPESGHRASSKALQKAFLQRKDKKHRQGKPNQ